MSVAASNEIVNYDSDPGERPNEETGKQKCVTHQADDNDVIKLPEDRCIDVVNIFQEFRCLLLLINDYGIIYGIIFTMSLCKVLCMIIYQ